jgi:hypothetical protein
VRASGGYREPLRHLRRRQYVDAAGHRIFVRATHPTHPGEEIYADYGPSYWNPLRGNALVVGARLRSRPGTSAESLCAVGVF